MERQTEASTTDTPARTKRPPMQESAPHKGKLEGELGFACGNALHKTRRGGGRGHHHKISYSEKEKAEEPLPTIREYIRSQQECQWTCAILGRTDARRNLLVGCLTGTGDSRGLGPRPTNKPCHTPSRPACHLLADRSGNGKIGIATACSQAAVPNSPASSMLRGERRLLQPHAGRPACPRVCRESPTTSFPANRDGTIVDVATAV